MSNVIDLQHQLDQAIENCDFQLAQQIKDQINKLIQDGNNNIANQYVQSFQQLTDECKSNFEEEMNSLDESISNQEILIRRKVSNIFHELQVQHVQVLLHIEKENLFRYAKEQFRVIPEVLEIKEQAKLAAYNSQYDQAIIMKEKAEQVEEEELQRREENIKGQFYSRRSVVLGKQKDEIRALTKQLNTALYNLQKRKEFEIDKIYQMYRKSLKESFDNIKIFIKSIKDTNLRNQCLSSCLQIYKEKMADTSPSENQQNVFYSPKSATTSRPQSQLSSSKFSNNSKDLQNQQTPPDSPLSTKSATISESSTNQKKYSSPSKTNKSSKTPKSPSSSQMPSPSSKSPKSSIPVKTSQAKSPRSPSSSSTAKSTPQKSSKSLIPVKSKKRLQ